MQGSQDQSSDDRIHDDDHLQAAGSRPTYNNNTNLQLYGLDQYSPVYNPMAADRSPIAADSPPPISIYNFPLLHPTPPIRPSYVPALASLPPLPPPIHAHNVPAASSQVYHYNPASGSRRLPLTAPPFRYDSFAPQLQSGSDRFASVTSTIPNAPGSFQPYGSDGSRERVFDVHDRRPEAAETSQRYGQYGPTRLRGRVQGDAGHDRRYSQAAESSQRYGSTSSHERLVDAGYDRRSQAAESSQRLRERSSDAGHDRRFRPARFQPYTRELHLHRAQAMRPPQLADTSDNNSRISVCHVKFTLLSNGSNTVDLFYENLEHWDTLSYIWHLPVPLTQRLSGLAQAAHSSEGLVLLQDPHIGQGHWKSIVCNPISRKVRELPILKLPTDIALHGPAAVIHRYPESKNYKVVVIFCHFCAGGYIYLTWIYDNRQGRWKSSIPTISPHFLGSIYTVHEGKVYFLTVTSRLEASHQNILTFDFHNEKWDPILELPSPRSPFMRIVGSKQNLYLLNQERIPSGAGTFYRLWILDQQSRRWSHHFYFRATHDLEIMGWYNAYGFRNGKIYVDVFGGNGSRVLQFDPENLQKTETKRRNASEIRIFFEERADADPFPSVIQRQHSLHIR